MKSLTLLSRTYCHLCDDMLAALESHPGRPQFELTVIDIDQHTELERRFGDKVPVLLEGEHEICHYFLDLAGLEARLGK